MDLFIKLPIILVLIFILVSLFQAMYYLAKDDGKNNSTRVVKALTIRIVLSLLLFSLLILGYLTGILQPHGV